MANCSPPQGSMIENFTQTLVIDMQNFDVILRMDLLLEYNAAIYFCKKKVIFNPIYEGKFELVGNPRKTRNTINLFFESKETFEV